MKILALDSSTSRASLALFENGKVLASDFSDNLRSHSEFLNPAVEKALRQTHVEMSSIDLFACSFGPGSFTGVRVALELVKSLAFAFKKPIYSMSSLDLLNASAGNSHEPRLCLINAFKNMTYTACYQGDQLLKGPEAVRWVDLATWLPPNFANQKVQLLGDALKSYSLDELANQAGPLKERFILPTQEQIHPSATVLAGLAEKNSSIGKTYDWKFISPLYIRASEAEENLRKKQ